VMDGDRQLNIHMLLLMNDLGQLHFININTKK